jgi:ureidoacrylate peracid hydrolase
LREWKAIVRELVRPELRTIWTRKESALSASPNQALLLIDFQQLLGDSSIGLGERLRALGARELARRYYSDAADATRNAELLLRRFRSAGLPVVHTHLACATVDGRDVGALQRRLEVWAANGSPAADFLSALRPVSGEIVIPRTTFSLFATGVAAQLLRNCGITKLVIAGIGTEWSVASTARDAAELGFEPLVVEDACVGLEPTHHRASLDFLELWYCIVRSTQAVLSAAITASPV